MIDLKNVYEIRNVINNEIVDKIEDELGNIIYESYRLLTISGIPPITLQKCKSANLVDYKVYGNSIQDGTPTPDAPIEIESVGDKTENLWEFDFKEFSTSTRGTVYTFSKPITKPCTFFYRNNDFNSDGNAWIIWFKRQSGGHTYAYPNHIKKNSIINISASEDNPLTEVQFRNGGSTYISGGSIDNFMLVEGTYDANTMPKYEPYGYRVPVTTRGKNLLDYKQFIKEDRTFEIENGLQYENLIGTYNVSFPFTFKTNTSYTLSADITGNIYFGGLIYANFSGYVWLTSERKSVIIYNTRNEDVTVTLYCRLINDNPDVISTIKNLQLEIGETSTDYEEYSGEPVTTNIYLNEPLRKIGDYADYIDFENQKEFRNVEVLDDTGTLIIEESYKGVVDDTGTDIELPNIPTFKGTTIIEVDTNILPSNMEVKYIGKK